MPLQPGTRLGRYEIGDIIGAGGMGEVYLAQDTELRRTVAIKVLSGDMVADGERKKRFVQEARAASALNHPNIVTLYDIASDGAVDFLVMEYLKGTPLNQAIPAGGMARAEVLDIGIQIARALGAAHAAGIVHRDIKPANVMVLDDGHAKVLDFGLAKVTEPAVLGADMETLTQREGLTKAGVVMGTMAYMSPEQARGEVVDVWTDVFSFGAVLYEMASGRRAFSRALDWTAPQPLGDRKLDGLIREMLSPDKEKRLRTAEEVAVELERMRRGPASRRHWLWAAGAAGVAGLAVWKVSSVSEARLSDGGHPSKIAEANEYYERALLYLGTGARHDPREVRRLMERALGVDPKFAAARGQIAFLHALALLQGDSNDPNGLYKGEEEAQRALRDDPQSAVALSALAGIFYLQGRNELVPAEVEKALAVNPYDPAARMWRVLSEWANGEHDSAARSLREILTRTPLFWPARMNLGEVLREQGDIAGAIREQERLLDQDPTSRVVLICLARAYMDSGRIEKARQTLDRLPAADRKNYRARVHWALLYALEGKKADTIRELDSDMLAYAGISAFQTPLIVAEAFLLAGDEEKALEWLDRGVRMGDSRSAWMRRDPMLAKLQGNPRFERVVTSIDHLRKQRMGQ